MNSYQSEITIQEDAAFEAVVTGLGCGTSLYVKIDYGGRQAEVHQNRAAYKQDWGFDLPEGSHVAGFRGAAVGSRVRVKRIFGSSYFDYEITAVLDDGQRHAAA
jgi:hypothetical protein